MKFITMDFETATADRDSPCEIGLTFVENSQIKDVKSWLIKPYYYPHFDDFNVSIHGIRPEDVKHAPEFDSLWQEIKPLIEGQFLIAHNAAFDMSVLRRTLERYDILFPETQYSCSYIFSKKVWKDLPAYDLKTLCQRHHIPLNHHRAAADSEATAKLALKAFEIAEVKSLEDFPSKLSTTVGRLFEGGYISSKSKRKSSKTVEIVGDSAKHNPESPFYGRTVVFTGKLLSMTRHQAQQLIADIGGLNGQRITKSTHYLIIGQQDYRVVGDEGMSSKQKKAIQLVEKGHELEILSEEEFLKNI